MDTAAYAFVILSAISVHTDQTADEVNSAITIVDRAVGEAAPYVSAYFPFKSEHKLIAADTGRLATHQFYPAAGQPRTTRRPSV